jgi:hypothetical protein
LAAGVNELDDSRDAFALGCFGVGLQGFDGCWGGGGFDGRVSGVALMCGADVDVAWVAV